MCEVKYLVSSPHGDIIATKEKFSLPLDGDPLKTPYGVYFSSVHAFIAQNNFKSILKILSNKLERKVYLKTIKEILIRAEKHGFFYHPASVEFITDKEKAKFGVNVAISETGKKWLKQELEVLKELNRKFDFHYLPKVYLAGEINSMWMTLVDWFENYHEFHLSKSNGKQILVLWDFNKGYKTLSQKEGYEIYKQAAKILTLYYDIKRFKQIYPWHHAAGDFVAKIENEKVDVRLTTARGYEPVLVFQEKSSTNTLIALFYFFLNLTLRMRLDRSDGVGEILWADNYCLHAAIEGFWEALQFKKECNQYLNDFLKLLKSFSPLELRSAFSGLMKLYEDKEDYPVIKQNLENHIKELYKALRNL